jgi:predicted PolB exonuclease-like 3'-5' exonuclease
LKNTGDFFLENMLYFSQETLDLIMNLLKDLGSLLDDKVELSIGDFKGYLNYEDIEMKDKFHTIRYKEMDQTLIVLRKLMRKELSISNE